MDDCRTAHENPVGNPAKKPTEGPVLPAEARHAGAHTRVSAGQAASRPESTKARLPKGTSALRSPARRPGDELRWSLARHLTDRDRDVLRAVSRHRVLTTPQLARLYFDSHKRAAARLLDLLRLRVLERFRPLREPWGSHPWHWVTGANGAAVLAAERDEDPDRAARRWRGERVLAYATAQRVAHLVGTNEVYVALAVRARHGHGSLLDWLTEPESAAWADGIVRPDGWGVWDEDGRSVEFFLEYDRGTETLGRLVDKLPGYEKVEDQRGVSAWVLFAFTSARREQTARRALADATVPVATAALVDGVEPTRRRVVAPASHWRLRATGGAGRRRQAARSGRTSIGGRAASMAVRAMSERLLLRPEEAARVLGIGRSKLYELLAAGRIESVRIGSSRRVPVEGLHDYVQRLRLGRELVDGEASTYATQRRAGVGT